MKKLNIYIFALLGILGCTLAACDDDDVSIAKAVLASAPSLSFDATSATPQTILVYADADWYSEAPDYVTVTPATGHAGTTEVTVSVTDNVRDGAIDNPRQFDILFRGDTKKSIATVTVFQDGDTYRDVAESTIAQVNATADKNPVVMSPITLAYNLKSGQLITDGTDFAYITGKPEGLETVGTVGTLFGIKNSDDNGLPYVQAEVFNASGSGEFTPGTPVDITAEIDTYAPTTMTYVSVTGHMVGASLIVADQELPVTVFDAEKSINMAEMDSHSIVLTGYFAGKTKQSLRLIATAVEDLGLYEIVYFRDDFEWLEPWAAGANVGQTVETDDLDATATALTSIKADVEGTEMTCYDYIESRGYTFVYDKNDNKRIYLQRNYLKFGKTGNHAGLTLPSITTVPEGENAILTFDWCPMRQGSGKIDPVNLYVKVENGSDVKQFDIPECGWENGHKLEWIKATVDLSGVTIDKNTKITISQTQWEVGTANRWFLDNIKLFPKE